MKNLIKIVYQNLADILIKEYEMLDQIMNIGL